MNASTIIGKSVKTGKYIHINDVNKKDNDTFICNCGGELIPVKGEAHKKEYHFRHPSDSNITACRNKALHNYAVQVINENTKITITEKLKIEYFVVGTEVWLNDLYRSDITVKYQNEDVHFEVFVTHDLGEAKTTFYQDSKIKSVRIDLSNPDLLTASQETIKDKILNQYRNKVLIYWESKDIELSKEPVYSQQKGNSLVYVIIAIAAFFGLRWLYKKIFD